MQVNISLHHYTEQNLYELMSMYSDMYGSKDYFHELLQTHENVGSLIWTALTECLGNIGKYQHQHLQTDPFNLVLGQLYNTGMLITTSDTNLLISPELDFIPEKYHGLILVNSPNFTLAQVLSFTEAIKLTVTDVYYKLGVNNIAQGKLFNFYLMRDGIALAVAN